MGLQAISLGEMLIDFVAQDQGRLRDVSGFVKHPGGAPANVAVGLSRLGVSTGFIGKLGDDEFGRFLHGVLCENNVETSGVRFTDQAHTALAFVSLTAQGERDFVFYRHPGADELLGEADVDPAYLGQAKLLHAGSLSLTHPCARAATRFAVEQAKSQGLIFSFDPNVRPALWADAAALKQAVSDLLPLADIVKLSLEDALFLLGDGSPVDLLDVLFSTVAPKLLILTLGKRGCLYRMSLFQGHHTGFEVDALDTTGAGDGFMAGLLAYLIGHGALDALEALSEVTLDDALTYAQAVAALTVMRQGAISALPDASQVDAFLNALR